MISILCPTRNRPAHVRKLVESARETSQLRNFEFVFYLDDDDPNPLPEELKKDLRSVVGPRIVLAQMWNECAKVAKGDIFMHCGDDIVFRSVGWDRAVEEAFAKQADKILLVYGMDGIHNEKLSTHSFISRKWVETVGYFVPPYFSCDWCDQWVFDVAGLIGRRKYLPEVFTQHCHYTTGLTERDQTAAERETRGSKDNVDRIYIDKEPERIADAAKLRAVMHE